MDPSTRFDDDQIRDILMRAAERQEQADRALPAAEDGSRAGDLPGLSLAELQSVAKEVGIAPAHVEAAAREARLAPAGPVERYRIVGVPRETTDYRLVPGSLGDREWEQIVEAVREEFRVPGVANDFGEIREWWSSAQTTAGGVRLRMEPGERGTAISLRRSNRNLSETTGVLTGVFAGLAGFSGLAASLSGAGRAALAGPVIFGTLGALTWVFGVLLSRNSVRQTGKRFRRLMDRIELIVRSGSKPM